MQCRQANMQEDMPVQGTLHMGEGPKHLVQYGAINNDMVKLVSRFHVISSMDLTLTNKMTCWTWICLSQ
eukprot:2881262-Prorocentrum_lima.AAC.1